MLRGARRARRDGHANARRHRDRRCGSTNLAADVPYPLPQTIGEQLCAARTGVREQNGEFLSANARDDIARSARIVAEAGIKAE